MSDFTTFQTFYSMDEATTLVELLKANNIGFEIVKSKAMLDHNLVGEDLDNRVFLKIRSSDFSRANKILDEEILKNINTIEQDYYLFSFTNNELKDIIEKPDEWNRQDFLIAKKILADRGMAVTDERIASLEKGRVKELSVPEKGDPFWITFGYFIAVLGGFMGFIIGLPYMIAKKNLPDGSRIFVYDNATRTHGKTISIICAIAIVFNIFFGTGVKYVFMGMISYLFF